MYANIHQLHLNFLYASIENLYWITLTNSDPNEMPPIAVFHQDLLGVLKLNNLQRQIFQILEKFYL